MSTAVSVQSRISSVEVTDEAITARLVDGRVISVPLAWSSRLSDATPAQRRNWARAPGLEGTGPSLQVTLQNGQRDEYPVENLVDADLATAAIEYFFATAQRTST